MKITHYSFGKITIGGKTYTSDVIIYPERVDPSWWRKEGHYLQPEDLEDVIDAKPDILIIGTGYSGVMQVPEKTIRYLKAKGIEVYAERTEKAVEMFDKKGEGKKVIAALHLTC
ncbi:MAG: Mth938-like domain-containing protein [Nitrospirae bacterium]|nr:Mth938-like domain-containing protein [Nitrospirota bacterium]